MPTSSFAGRAFMPDMASLSLSIIALYLFARWLERAPAATLFVAMSLATSLAILVKPPAVLISVPLLAMGLFVMIAGAGNHRHDWYQLPFVPGGAALGVRPWVAGLAAVSYICVMPHYEPKRLPLWQAGREIDRITPRTRWSQSPIMAIPPLCWRSV